MLGAAGVNLGTRFIACRESPAPDEWKQAIVAARSEDIMRAEVLNDIVPLPGTAGFGTVLRSIHTEFLDRWSANREEARRERDRLKAEIISTTQAGRPHATLLTAGQTAGGITDVPAVAELMRRLIAEAEAVLVRASSLVADAPARMHAAGVRV
jgi:NAD(P)H-dependent flavin oxidoreductase YrpB (nitropropane dioxygenase family)